MLLNQAVKTKLTCILFLFSLSLLTAQNNDLDTLKKEKSVFWQKVHFGGGIGLNFSNGYSYAALSPTGLYQFNDQFGLGVGLNANYSKHKNDYEATVLGGSIIGIFKPIRELQLSTEFEENNVAYKNLISDAKSNYWQPALFLGAGYSIGDFGAIGLRYDVLYNDKKSPYGTAFLPFVRVYF